MVFATIRERTRFANHDLAIARREVGSQVALFDAPEQVSDGLHVSLRHRSSFRSSSVRYPVSSRSCRDHLSIKAVPEVDPAADTPPRAQWWVASPMRRPNRLTVFLSLGGGARSGSWSALLWAIKSRKEASRLSSSALRPRSSANPATSRALVLEDRRQVESAETPGVGEDVDCADLSIPDREAPDRERLLVAGRDGPCGAVDERRSHEQAEPQEGERLLGHGARTANLPRCARANGTPVASHHDVRIKHLEQRLEVAVARGSEEGVDDFALSVEVGVGNRDVAPDPAARAAGELACRLGGVVDDRRDLLEGHPERIMQNESAPLGRGERFEHHEQRQSYRVGQQRLVLGVDPALTSHDRVGQARAPRALPRVLRASRRASVACPGTLALQPSSAIPPGSRRHWCPSD